MRTAFIDELVHLAENDDSVFLIVGDLGFSVVEPFAERFPDRFLNAGIAEQNMSGVAAGLAMCGHTVFTYSIANFPTLRCLEQIRNDICYHNLNVTIVSVGAGLAYGSLGYSHHAVQDIACMRGFPGMMICTPGDPQETRAVLKFVMSRRGPTYLRLGKSGEPAIHKSAVELNVPALLPVAQGRNNGALIACGTVLPLCAEVARIRNLSLFSAPLWSSGLLTHDLVRLVTDFDYVVIVEEHLYSGGFGSFVRESLEEFPELQGKIRICALSQACCSEVGSQSRLRDRGGLSVEKIIDRISGGRM